MFYKIRLTIDEINEINKGLKFVHRQRKEQIKHMIKNRDATKIVKSRTRKPNKLLKIINNELIFITIDDTKSSDDEKEVSIKTFID